MSHIIETYPKTPSICNCMNVRRAARAVTQFYDDILKPSGLTINQLGLLRNLENLDTATIGKLASLLRIDRTTLNRNLKPLVEVGFITINPGQDSRTRQIELTQAGRDSAAKAWKLWGEAQESLKEYLGEDDLRKLIHLLSKLEALKP